MRILINHLSRDSYNPCYSKYDSHFADTWMGRLYFISLQN